MIAHGQHLRSLFKDTATSITPASATRSKKMPMDSDPMRVLIKRQRNIDIELSVAGIPRHESRRPGLFSQHL
jgi:hypothetical protein